MSCFCGIGQQHDWFIFSKTQLIQNCPRCINWHTNEELCCLHFWISYLQTYHRKCDNVWTLGQVNWFNWVGVKGFTPYISLLLIKRFAGWTHDLLTCKCLHYLCGSAGGNLKKIMFVHSTQRINRGVVMAKIRFESILSCFDTQSHIRFIYDQALIMSAILSLSTHNLF